MSEEGLKRATNPPEVIPPLAVIGSSIILPGGIETREQFYQHCRKRCQTIIDAVKAHRYHETDIDELADPPNPWKLKSRYSVAFTRDQAISYDAHLFNISGKLAKNMHVHQFAALTVTFEALEDAGIPLHAIHKTRTGVFCAAYSPFLPSAEAPDETVLRGSVMSSIPDQIHYFLGTHGPSTSLETACSSSMVALSMAANALSVGDCDTAIVVGVNYLSEKDFHLSLQACGVLVQGPTCHPFDEDGNKGFMRGEGMGAVVLRRLSDAERNGDRILGSILRAVAAHGGAADGAMEGAGRVYEQPCKFGMRQMFHRAFDSAHVPLKRLNYMECHATGTAVGDILELEAIGDVFGDSHDIEGNPLRLASVKANIGHAEIAAGMFSLIKVLSMFKHRQYLPSAGVTTPLKAFDWHANNMCVQLQPEPFPEDRAVIVAMNSFGIGGAYGHCILEEYRKSSTYHPPTCPPALVLEGESMGRSDGGYLLPLSAVGLDHLKLFAGRLAEYMRKKKDVSLQDICATMWIHRSRFKFRKSFVARSSSEMAEQLAGFAKTANVQPAGEGRKMQCAYVFTGQGSQYPGVGKSLMHFPVYRQAVTSVDSTFKSLSGWSILEKSETLSAEEMRDTMYAQPITFLVQIGLFELLKFFRIFPDVVAGHSAGEVTAAYAAGLLTLEEAVKVVYHRSLEQQRMAGSGRLLVVGLNHEEVKKLVEPYSDVELACYNSPESTVLASSEERLQGLLEVKVFPETVPTVFVPGNIAFHSSRITPILEDIRNRLSFLNAQGSTGWTLPFISTVSGKIETRTDANYWVHNVRRPVMFQEAIESMFVGDTCPDVVLEIGPHQTLVSPIRQILGATGKTAAVLPTLKKGAPCAQRFLEAVGALFEKGIGLDLTPHLMHYGYTFEEDLPKHPMIKKYVSETAPVRQKDIQNGMHHQGPCAGAKKFFGENYVVQISDRTQHALTDHVMGGQQIVPGMFFVEMALEAVNTLPCTFTNIEFKSMLRIPATSKGENSAFVYLTMQHEQDDVQTFTVQSCPVREKWDEEPLHVTHCTGRILTKHQLLTSEGEVFPGCKPEAHGLMQGLQMQDLGEEGLKRLITEHSDQRHPSREAFYGFYNVEGAMEYREAMQKLDWMYVHPTKGTGIAKLTTDLTHWQSKGGYFTPELLDSLLHQAFYTAVDAGVYYAGGFDAIHWLRRPSTPDIYAHFLPSPELIIGRRSKVGDYAVYDGVGKLVLYLQGYYCILGGFVDNYKTMDLKWQPYDALASPSTEEAAQAALSMPREGEEKAGWSKEEEDRLTQWLVRRLKSEGVLDDGGLAGQAALPTQIGSKAKGSKALKVPLSSKVREALKDFQLDAEASSSAASLPQLGGLEHLELEPLASALAHKVRGVTPSLDEAGDAGISEKKGQWTAEDLHNAITVGSFQHLEAQRIAQSLRTLAESNQKTIGQNYVIRILELAEDAIMTVYEVLAQLDLPASITVEYFLGSFNSSTLMALASKVTRRPANLRLRRVLFSPNVARELKDMSFEAVVLGDWIRSGQMVWQGEKQGSKPSENAMDLLTVLMAPNAQLYIRGLNDIPLWVRLLSQLSPAPLSLAPESTDIPPSKARDEWLTVLHAYGDVHSTSLTPNVTLLSCTFAGQTPEASQASGQVLVFAETAEDGEQAARAISAKNGNIKSHVYVINGQTSPLTDASEVSDYEDVLRARLSAFVNQKAEQDSGKEDDTESLSSVTTPGELQGNWGDNLPLAGMLFLAGCRDQDSIGEKGFGRLMKLVQAINKTADLVHNASKGSARSLWVVTRGVYVGDIVPAQGVLQGFTSCLNGELPDMTVKFVDINRHLIDSDVNSQALASLLTNHGREKSYTIVDGKVSVARTNQIKRSIARSAEILADDPNVCFFADCERHVTPGKISLRYRVRDLPPPQAGEVQVDVYAAALNFRDVMIGLSLLPEKSYEASFYGKNFGMEASGVVRAVGDGVQRGQLKVGDKVIISAARCFANRLNLPAHYAVKFTSNDLTFEDAASIQTVYNTSHHALVNLARLRKGEKILIHSAAGGIGHAAISIAKYLGAEIYATAGSDEKRQIVRDLGVQHIYNSRNIDWFHDLMRDTDNKGVDVVLNSLAGKHQRLGIQALRSSGRFCEIGKVDIFDDNKLGLLAFRKNISFFAIDMDRLLLDDPQLSSEIANEVGHRFEAGDYAPLPIKTFPMGQILPALEFMKSGKHTGKVVLMNYERQTDGSFQPLPVTVERPQRTFHAHATYLITGGGGGFGSRLVMHAWKQGSRHFIVTTRSSNHEKIEHQFKAITDDPACSLKIVTCDTAQVEDMQDLCDLLHHTSPPTEAIFHCAGVSNDVTLPDLTLEKYHEVADCKAKAAWLLHKGTLDLPLETFVTISSIAAHVGGKGTASYSAANAYLDALVRYRRSQGLPAMTYNMAAISDVGILANNLQARKFQQKVGMEFISCKEALDWLDDGMTIGTQELICMFFTERTRHLFPMISPWSYQLEDAITLGAVVSDKAHMNPKEIAAFLADEIRSITGVTEVLTTSQLTQIGLDSLGFVELGGRMKKNFGIEADSVKMSAEMTLDDVSKMVYKLQQQGQMASSKSGAGAEAAAQATDSADTMVLHSKQEMNDMIISSFESPTMGSSVSPLSNSTPSRRSIRALSLTGSRRLHTEMSTLSHPRHPPVFTPHRLGNVLLFGSDDFRGVHMLRYLIKGGAQIVYCIGKWSTAEGGMARLTRLMQRLNCWKEHFAKHIVPISGDVAKANFALSPAEYDRLITEVDSVVHASGSLKWYMDPALVAANVSGLMNIVAFCRRNRAPIHFLSTAWVSGWEAANDRQRKIVELLAYVNIKRKAEDVLHYAVRHYGLRAAIYRLPALATSRRGGSWTAYGADNMLFQAVQKIYASRMVDAQHCDDVITMATVDDACKSVVRTMKARRGTTSPTKGMAAIHLDMSILDHVTTRDLADWVEELTGRKIYRNRSSEDLIQWAGKHMHMEGPFLEAWRKLQVEAMPVIHGVTKQLIQQTERKASSLQVWRYKHRFDRSKGGAPRDVFRRFLLQNQSLLSRGFGADEEAEETKTMDTDLNSASVTSASDVTTIRESSFGPEPITATE